jgi:hypothetical protein
MLTARAGLIVAGGGANLQRLWRRFCTLVLRPNSRFIYQPIFGFGRAPGACRFAPNFVLRAGCGRIRLASIVDAKKRF